MGALHLGDHNLNAGVRPFPGQQEHERMTGEIMENFARADIPQTLRLMDKHFAGTCYSLRSLFRDEQKKVLDELMNSLLADADANYRQLYEMHAPLMRFLSDLRLPLPKVLRLTAEWVINSSLRRALEEEIDPERVSALLDSARRERVTLDAAGLAHGLKKRLSRLNQELRANPRDPESLKNIEAVVALARSLPFEVDLWQVQNSYYELRQGLYRELLAQSDDEAHSWVEKFDSLGRQLGMQTETEPEVAAAELQAA